MIVRFFALTNALIPSLCFCLIFHITNLQSEIYVLQCNFSVYCEEWHFQTFFLQIMRGRVFNEYDIHEMWRIPQLWQQRINISSFSENVLVFKKNVLVFSRNNKGFWRRIRPWLEADLHFGFHPSLSNSSKQISQDIGSSFQTEGISLAG